MALAVALNQPKYNIGDVPIITARFTNSANALTTPTTTTFILVDPTGTQTTTASPNAAISSGGTGILIYAYPVTTGLAIAGMWSWRVKGVGVVPHGLDGTFEVRPSLAITP